MKNIFFRLTLLALAVLTITLYSCQQEDILEDIQSEVMLQDTDNADMDLRGPNIEGTVNAGTCCSYKTRKVNINLTTPTYNFFCADGDNLTYKFYRNNNPNANPIVRYSNLDQPSFCLSEGKSYTLLITDGSAELGYNGNFYIITNGSSTSPIYTVSLAGCNGTPTGPSQVSW